jgi:hypothetical protein
MASLTNDIFAIWLEGYGSAWRTGDADAAVGLFTDSARYHETPFDEPMVGRDAIHQYWKEGAGQSQKDIQFSYDILRAGERTGIAHWRASFVRVPSGNLVHLDGILLAEFDAELKCASFREWWHRQENPAA